VASEPYTTAQATAYLLTSYSRMLLAEHTYLLLTTYSAAMARATLVVSYWSAPSSNLSWFDQPPCEAGDRGQDACGETVRLSKLSLQPDPFN